MSLTYLSVFLFVSGIVFSLCSIFEKVYLRRKLLARLKGKSVLRSLSLRNNILAVLSKTGKNFQPKSPTDVQKIKSILIKAGFRHKESVSVFYGLRFSISVLLAFVAFCFFYSGNGITIKTLFFSYLFLLAGYLSALFILKRICFRRNQAIFRELPDVLDIMLICLDAGMSFNNVLIRVSKELQTISPVLSKELRQYFHEVNSGLPRNEALKNLSARNDSKHLDSVVNVLIQSSKFGTDISRALSVYADSLRKERLQLAEERGVKVSTKLAFPLTLCILPALMIVISGGSILKIINAFKNFLM